MMSKLEKLRAEMKKRGIDGFFIPRADEFQGEYVPDSANRLQWITGFSGSAGSAIVLVDKAAFFTDGRYTIAAQAEVNAKDFQLCSLSDNQPPLITINPADWIANNLKAGEAFGIDPWLHTPNEVKKIKEAVEKAGGTLKLLDDNPLDAAWGSARPHPPKEPAVVHGLEYAGKPSVEKCADLAALLAQKDCKALAITLPEDICWLLNVRGNDVPCTPFVLSYALLRHDGTVDWFVDQEKISDDIRQWVGKDVRIHPLQDFAPHVQSISASGDKIWIDPAATPVSITALIAHTHAERNPIQLMKARKNKTEIDGAIRAHIRDGIAVTRFLAVLAEQGAPAKFDEISASDLLEKLRSEGEKFKGLSFDTISGSGGNGAIVHYRSSPETNQPILSGPVYLVDSGGQYLDGTTDITRTIAVDNVTEEMKDRYTRVLKGHIQVATSIFPEGTTGDKLDAKARSALKEVGLDYAHGTGHGVGSYLSVHEGPCGISPRSTSVALEPGMIISNEPGYYKEGEYGIRIENLVLVIDTGKTDKDGKKLLGFQTLTLAPIDKNLIEPSLLDDAELKWLNDYHTQVQKTLTPLLKEKDPKAVLYLERATQPLHKPQPPKSKKINGFFL